MTTYADLIAKLEAATEADPQLLWQAYRLLVRDTPDLSDRFSAMLYADAFTDAALTLLPPGYRWDKMGRTVYLCEVKGPHNIVCNQVCSSSKYVPHAIAAACLKAMKMGE